MSAERFLVIALALVSTLAAGLSVDARAGSSVTARQLVAIAIANVVALPLVTFGLLHLASADATRPLVLAAAASGGSTGPLLAVLGRGDSPTAALAFVVLTLVGVAAALVATMALDIAGLTSVLVASVVVVASSVGPLLAGLAIRARRPAIAAAWQPWLSRLGLVLLLAVIGWLAVRHGETARVEDVLIGAIVTALALAIGAIARGRAAQIAVAQVSGVRNLTLVLLVLAVVGAPPAETMAVLAYGLSMYVVTLAAAAWWRSAMKPP